MRRGACLLAVASLVAPPALADDEPDALVGGVEVGYRDVQVEGNASKYREDVNLADDAFRLFEVDLAWRPQGDGALDELTLDAHNLGNEPQSWAQFRARNIERWDLKASWRSSDFFYRDAGYFYRDGGDLHAWDTNRTFYDLDFRLKAAQWVTLRLGADRTTRDGRSTSSRDVQREAFVLERPVDQTATSYWLGADFRAGWLDLTVEQRLSEYENTWRMTSAASDGEAPGGASLDAYRQSQSQQADTPISRVSVAGRPADWLRFSAGYVRADADLDYSVDGAWSGLDYDESPTGDPPEPYSTTLANAGRVERIVDTFTADVALRPATRLELTLAGGRRSYEQAGTIDWVEEQTGGKDAGTRTVAGELHDELQLDDVGLTARWDVARVLALTAGVSYQERSAAFELAGPEVTTKRTLYRGGIRFRPGTVVDLRADYEQGSDDDPYTPVSPTDIDRLRAELILRPAEGLRVSLRFKDETRDNDLAYPLGLPTDDVPPATEIARARFDVTSWGGTLGWSRGERVDVFVGYDRTEIGSDADIVYVTGATFVPVFDIFTTLDRTAYESNQDSIQGAVRFGLGRGWSVGATASLVRNDGTFPLDWTRYGAEARYEHGSGAYLRLAYDFYELDETNPYAGDPAAPTPDVNDYQAELWTAALGYRF